MPQGEKSPAASPGAAAAEAALPRNFLRAGLLLLLLEEPGHGYDLRDRLQELGVVDHSGRIYRELRRMEKNGTLTSSWEPSAAGPPRRSYELTPRGERLLSEWVGTLQGVRAAVGSYLARYGGLDDRHHHSVTLDAPGERVG